MFVWWCLMKLSTIFQLYCGVSFIGGGPGGKHRPVASHWQTLSHNVVHLALIEIRTHNISADIFTPKIVFNAHLYLISEVDGQTWLSITSPILNETTALCTMEVYVRDKQKYNVAMIYNNTITQIYSDVTLR
jgi:hypothetical protein